MHSQVGKQILEICIVRQENSYWLCAQLGRKTDTGYVHSQSGKQIPEICIVREQNRYWRYTYLGNRTDTGDIHSQGIEQILEIYIVREQNRYWRYTLLGKRTDTVDLRIVMFIYLLNFSTERKKKNVFVSCFICQVWVYISPLCTKLKKYIKTKRLKEVRETSRAQNSD